MPTFLELISLEDALGVFLKHLPQPSPPGVTLSTIDALNCILLEDVTAQEPLPPFTRSTVDGYAVLAADTYGASDSLPVYLNVIGEVPMGASPDFQLSPQTSGIIHTGGMLPPGANAVVMIEDTQISRKNEIEIFKSVAVGENIIEKGEDVQPGDLVLRKGTRLGPAQIGGLLSLGILNVRVVKPARVGILSSGDEVIDPGREPKPGQVRDINSYTLRALIQRNGGEPVLFGIVPDDLAIFEQRMAQAFSECDMVIVTAGSSASVRDLTAQVIQKLGEPGVLVHGVRIRPGKPTILAVCQGKPVIGLPGNPVSAIVIASQFVIPALEWIMGKMVTTPQPRLVARLKTHVPSIAGREDFVPTHLVKTSEGYIAEPIFFKSNMIFSLAQADGLLHVPADAVGLQAGETVDVLLLT